MPALNGIEVLQEIRRRKSSIPVVVMTGFSEEETRPQIAGAEPVELVRKPFNASALLGALERLRQKTQ
jgi:two-component system response regulator FixJ